MIDWLMNWFPYFLIIILILLVLVSHFCRRLSQYRCFLILLFINILIATIMSYALFKANIMYYDYVLLLWIINMYHYHLLLLLLLSLLLLSISINIIAFYVLLLWIIIILIFMTSWWSWSLQLFTSKYHFWNSFNFNLDLVDICSIWFIHLLFLISILI